MSPEQERLRSIFSIADPRKEKQPIELQNMDRDDLAELFGKMGYRTGVELGVETGKYAQVLLEKNKNLHLYCVDAWRAYKGYRDHVTQQKVDGLLQMARIRLEPYEDRVTYIREYSLTAVKQFAPNSIDFVYIDANHTLPYVMDDICAWAPIVRPGGMVAGHDYCRRSPGKYQCHVVEAVQAYTTAYYIKPWFVVGRKDAYPGEKRDRPRSFFWVKEE